MDDMKQQIKQSVDSTERALDKSWTVHCSECSYDGGCFSDEQAAIRDKLAHNNARHEGHAGAVVIGHVGYCH